MKEIFTAACLVLAGLLLLSFTKESRGKVRNSEIAGFWMVENPSGPKSSYDIKVFERKGSFYNLSCNNGESVMSHKGKFKILDGARYRETVTHQMFNGRYALENKEFINSYELSKDGKRLVLSGTVVSKSGADTLRWSHVYKRIELPQ